ncbi:MAG TPA: dihydrodipicolinate synthase family protein [Streptosporangiaceae bacterium]
MTQARSEVFRGVGVALVTIFGEDGTVDPASTGKLARDLVERGMRAVLVNGSTGEAPTLADSERCALIGAVREAVPAGTPVIAGVGAPSVRQATALTRDAVAAGADAVLAWPPAGSRNLPAYFSAVSDAAGGRPVLAYHFPRVSAPGVPVDALAGLPVAGVKDSSGDPDRLLDEVAHYPGATYVGSSALLALAGPMGAAGALLALANIEPERCVAAFAGDAAVQRELADRHLAVRNGGPAELKRVLSGTHGLSPAARAD